MTQSPGRIEPADVPTRLFDAIYSLRATRRNPDGSLRETWPFPGGRGSSLFQACQNMMLAANALGISSLFTTFFGLKEQEIKQILGIPPRVFMEAAVFLGYGDEKLGNPRRKPLREVAHADRYGTAYEPVG